MQAIPSNRTVQFILLLVIALLCLAAARFTTMPTAFLSAFASNDTTVATHTYYVDANNGNDTNTGLSEAQAFLTLNKAVSLTMPGDTVLVMDGTYLGEGSSTATLRINRSGTPENWITYKAYPGHSPLIQSNGAWQTVRINANYIIVDGFRVRGIKNEIPVEEAEAAHLEFQNGGGLQERFHGSGIRLNAFNIVRNNEVFGFGGSGIETKHDSVIIENNLVYDNSHFSPVGHSGISVYEPINADGTNIGLEGNKYKIIVRGNISHSNYNLFTCSCLAFAAATDGNGIIVDSTRDYANWTLVANNVVFNNGGSGIHTYQASNVDIVNNSSFQNAQHPDIQGELFSRRSNNINILNNIIYAKLDQTVTSIHPGNNVTYDYNIYYDGTLSPDVPTLRGPHDVIADPMYVSPSIDPALIDLQLMPGSPALHTGSDAFMPMNDLNNITRVLGQVDRGAYEVLDGFVAPTATPEPPCGPLQQEAESGYRGGAWRLETNSGASNQEFIYVPASLFQVNPTEVDLHQATYCFNVPVDGDYRILVWGNANNRPEDTLLVTINGLLANGYLWQMPSVTSFNASYVTAQNEFEPVTIPLTSGNHTVSIYSGNDGPSLDKIELVAVDNSGSAQLPPTFTPTPTITPTPTQTWTPTITPTPTQTPIPAATCSGLYQEAEFGLLTGGFVIEADPNANDGYFVHVPDEGGGSGSAPNGTSAEYCFNVSTPGTYRINARVFGPNGNSDSFWLQINGDPPSAHRWVIDWQAGDYYIDEMKPTGADGPLELEFDTPGPQIVTVYMREDGARLDTIELVLVTESEPPIVDEPPTVENPGSQAHAEGDTVALTIVASDLDSPQLSFSATGLPPGLLIQPSSGQIEGTLPTDSAGAYDVAVTVSDATTTVSTSFTWTVNPPMSSCGGPIQEAEDGELHGGFVVVNDAEASGGAYITPVNVSSRGSIGASSYVDYCFTVPADGDYVLEGRYKAIDYLSDSFFLTIDGLPANGYRWNLRPVNGMFVTGRLMQSSTTPQVLTLTEGEHTLRIYIREKDAILDAFEIQPVVGARSLYVSEYEQEEYEFAEVEDQIAEANQQALLAQEQLDNQQWSIYLPFLSDR